MNELLRKLRMLFHRKQFENELDEELRHHLAMKAENQPGGAGELPFGNVALLKEESREVWTFVFWEQLAQDIRYGIRSMAASRLFTAMAVLSLALGIGANTTIYSVIDAVLLRALPVRQPEELVILNFRSKGDVPLVRSHWGSNYDVPGGGRVSPNLPYPALQLLNENNTVLTGLFGHAAASRLNLVVGGQAELGQGRYVSGDYFTVLGITPATGRLIGREDDQPGAPPVVVLTHDYWRSRFGADPSVQGRTVQINGKAFTIAGVAAPGFFGVSPDEKPSVFLPISTLGLVEVQRTATNFMTDDHYYWIELMGRRKPGVTLAQAETQLAGVFHNYVTDVAKTERERSDLPVLSLQPGGSGVDALRREYSKPLWVLMGMVGLILLIACANIANLLLARAASRRREMAVRLSLGAGRFRIVRQLLTESLMLALFGAVAGIGLAAAGIPLLISLMTNGVDEFTVKVGLDWHVLGFTLLVAVTTGVLFGLAPAIQATRVDVTPALKESRASGTGSRRHRLGLRQILVISQIALSLLLVVSASLFVRSLSRLHSVELGFNSENILLFNLDAGRAGYSKTGAKQLYANLERRFQGLPGVRAATTSDLPVVGGWASTTGITVPGIPQPPEGQRGPSTSVAEVGSTFFETMQLPVILGRAFQQQDGPGAAPVAVVNEVFAKKYFPGQNPIGRTFKLGGGDDNAMNVRIVGMARNARYNSLKREIPPVTYVPWAQTPDTRRLNEMFFELRTSSDALSLANTVRQIVHQAAPQVPVADITTQTRRIERTIHQERAFALLCAAFGGLALLMACVGLYGSMAYGVARRTSEIGIRMALGAQRRGVVWMVLREVLLLSIAGLAIGLAAVWQTTGVLKSLLFELKPTDPLALMASIVLLFLSALFAGYVPARRAARIDPMAALRHE